MSGSYLTNQFLIAMPGMADPNVAQTVTFVCEHSERGALGIVINRPLDMTLGEVFEQLGLESSDVEQTRRPVLRGGPVQVDRGFVLHTPGGSWDSTLPVSDRVHLTTSRDILDAMAAGEGPESALMALGYAGWGPGQLEHEMEDGSWLVLPYDEAFAFPSDVAGLWERALARLGVSPARVATPPTGVN